MVFDDTAVNDGAAMADCLVQLSPDVFTPDWRGKIINETAGNWKLRVSTPYTYNTYKYSIVHMTHINSNL